MNNITKYYNKKLVLNNISFEINKQCALFVGPNGSGKTTLFKILAGLIKNYNGNVDFDNNVSILLDSTILFQNKSGKENLAYFLNNAEYLKAIEYSNYFDIDYLDTKVRKYSNGMKKKISIIIALSKEKELYILDEPTNGMDYIGVEKLKKLLIEIKKNKKILISSHDIAIFDYELIDNIYLLKEHKLTELSKDSFNFVLYRIKTINEIGDEYKYQIDKDNYFIFKIDKNKINDFSFYISQFGVLEMKIINYFDAKYMENYYD